MSTTVAVWSPQEVETGATGADLTTRAMHNLECAILGGHLDDQFAEAGEWVAQVRAVSRVRKAAHAMNVQACRLEAAHARRAAQIGMLDVLEKKSYQQAAKKLAAMSTTEFAAYLDWIDQDGSVSALYGRYLFAMGEKARVRDIALGRVPSLPRNERGETSAEAIGWWVDRAHYPATAIESLDDVKEAAATLISTLTGTGEPFTTAEAAAKLARILDVDVDDAVTRTGLHVMVREALAVETRAGEPVVLPGGEWVTIPHVVTIVDTDGEWLRIPWASAGMEQLTAMAFHRRRQAEDMADAAKALEALADALAGESRGGDDNLCADLLDRLLESGSLTIGSAMKAGRNAHWTERADGRPHVPDGRVIPA